MAKCVYPICQEEPGSSKASFLYKFPDDIAQRKKWMSIIPQVGDLSTEKITSRSFLCTKHFSQDAFQFRADGKVKQLKPGAVPSIFYIPDNLKVEMLSEENGEPINVKPSLTQSSLSMLQKKLHNEEARVLLWKEKVKKEEAHLAKLSRQLTAVQNGEMTDEVEEVYNNLLSKLRPIAPKKPQKKKPKTLEEVIVHLRRERLISEEATHVLLTVFADVPLDDLSSVTPSIPQSVKEGIQCFAQVLAFYSSEVYENLKHTFDFPLPQLSAVRTWFNSDVGEPGWSHEAFKTLEEQAKKCSGSGKLLCALLVSESSLRKEEEWDGKKLSGYVDFGPHTGGAGFEMESDGLPIASSSLTLMVVPLDSQQLWRVPVAYFFINSLTSMERANIVRECIIRLHAVGAVVLSLTADPIFCDKLMLKKLGLQCDLLPHLCPYFVHPVDHLLRVHVVFDHGSLIQSLQHFWFGIQVFKDPDGQLVEWKYVSELIKVQEVQAGSMSQSSDAPLWYWNSPYTKHRLMAQLFSESTANAMEYCWKELKLTQFEGCEGTVQFIKIIGKCCELQNSQRYISKDKPTYEEDKNLKALFVEVLEYLFRMQDSQSLNSLHSQASCISQLYLSLMSVQELHRQGSGWSTHCFSLDQVELMVYNIRSYIGWNPLPTARQFKAAFSNHVLKYGYFTSWSCAQTNPHWWVDSIDVSSARREGRLVTKPELEIPSIPANCAPAISFEHMYPLADFKSLEAYQFVSLCVVRTVAELLHCHSCLEALQAPIGTDNPLLALLRKTGGAIICPSQDVILICSKAEHYLRRILKTSSRETKIAIFEWRDESIVTQVGINVMTDLLERSEPLFFTLQYHVRECAPDASHLDRLVRAICCCYVRMRIRCMKSWCPL